MIVYAFGGFLCIAATFVQIGYDLLSCVRVVVRRAIIPEGLST